MASLALVTDSTADLPADLVELYSIAVVPLTVHLDGQDLLDGVEIQPADLYPRLQAGRSRVSTSQPPPSRFMKLYEELLAGHDRVVSIHISGRLSGTYAAARQAAEAVDPGRIDVLDSRLASMALGLVVLAAAQAIERGDDPASVLATAAEVAGRVRAYFTVSTLEYLRRGGRIGGARALLGSVLRVKPVLTLTDGEVGPLERVRTYERAVARVVQLARVVGQGAGVCAVVAHALDEDVALRVAEGIEDLAESLYVQPLGPVVGVHAGPGTVGVACYPADVFPLGLGRRLPSQRFARL